MLGVAWVELYAAGAEQEEWPAESAHGGAGISECYFSNFQSCDLSDGSCDKTLIIISQEVLAWLRIPSNRNRYLDDLVWLIHDRFHIVCSTTTMSKMKRKWLRVIEHEETGRQLDETTRKQFLETHPDLRLLQQHTPTIQAQATDANQNNYHTLNAEANPIPDGLHDTLNNEQMHNLPQSDQHQNQDPYHDSHPNETFPNHQDQSIHPDLMLSFSQPTDTQSQKQEQEFLDPPDIDARLERQIQDEIANATATATAAAAVAVAEGGR